MKKWIFSIVFLIIFGIGILIYISTKIGTEGYLELADTFRKRGAYDQEIFNLEKALESSIKTNGTVSAKTAEIYRKLGNRDTNLTNVEEYFDMAIGIYQLEDKLKLPDVYYEKGYWLLNGGNATKEKAREAFHEAIELYEQNQRENSDNLCMSFYYLAFLEEDVEQRFTYLKKAETYFKDLSETQSWEITTIIERAIGAMLFVRGDYNLALPYYKALVKKSENYESEKAWSIAADAKALSGACEVFQGNVEDGITQIESALEDYGERDDDTLYYEQASANVYLAIAYASMQPPKTEEALEAGITGFHYYKQRKTITDMDLRKMEDLKYYLGIAYGKLYPEQDERGFEIWFDKNAKVNALNYQFYVN